MTIASSLDKPRLLLAAGLMLYLASLGAWLLLPGLYRPDRPLEPYLTVVTDHAHGEAARLLLDVGARDVITPENTEVLVSRFGSIDSVPLSVALATLDPLDPRRDPWIEGLGAYFSFSGRNAVYVRFNLPAGRVDRLVRTTLGPDSGIAEWSPLRTGGALLVFAVLAALALYFAGRERLRLVPAILPWVPAIAPLGLVAAAVAGVSVMYLGWTSEEVGRVSTLRRQHGSTVRSALGLRAIGLAVVVVLSLVYAGRLLGWRSLGPLLIALSGASLGSLVTATRFRRPLDTEHRPFVPVSILKARVDAIIGRNWSRLGLVALPVLLFLPPFVDALVSGRGAPRPVPVHAERRALTYEGIRDVWTHSSDVNLPDIADYLAHRAYQEGLAFGRQYGFPDPDEVVALSRYREESDGSYSSFAETVLTFDQAWVEGALRDAPVGLTSVLVDLGFAAGVVLAPVDAIYSGYSRFLQHLSYVVLVLAPFLLAVLPWARPTRSRGSILELSRRRKQVA
ncbi:MAG: hypothetical protein ACOC7V_13155 [Spirochaetota bacterium]